MVPLDHVVINTLRNMDAAADCFAALGFQLTPRGHHSLGSINHLMMTRGAYLELVGVPETGLQRQEVLDSPYGLNGLVLQSNDADKTFARLTAAGFPALAPDNFSRPVAIGGRSLDARFRTVRFPPGTFAGGRVYFCQHLTPELVWREEWFSHPNFFCGIGGVVIESLNERLDAERYAAALESSLERRGSEWRVNLADAQIGIVNGPTPRFATVDLLFENLNEIESRARLLTDAVWHRLSDREAMIALPLFKLNLTCRSIR